MLITKNEELNKFCEQALKENFIAVDTEFVREKTYYAQLCLIQAATKKSAVCIDPLAEDLDLTPFFKLLQHKKTVKVFHASRQDLEIFFNLTGKVPSPVFDTQIAAMVCGFGEQVSYRDLVEQLTDAKIEKGMQCSNWLARPLTDKQIKYALGDVTHLVSVYEKIKKRLKTTGRTEWIQEEMDALLDESHYVIKDEEAFLHVKCPFKRPQEIAVFQALCAWRERTAKEKNRPKRHILKDEALWELVQNKPTALEDFERFRFISKGFSHSDYALVILKVIQQALHSSANHFAVPSPVTGKEKIILEVLSLLLKITAEQNQVAASFVATGADLGVLLGKAEESRCLHGWRKEIFGQQALDFLQGKTALSFDPITQKLVLLPVKK